MLNILVSIIAFLVAISLLVVVHEFGHFWVARFFGIKVLCFSVGFGRPLYRFYDRLGTEYRLSAIPLGGYVSLLGERSGKSVALADRAMAFEYKPVWIRMLVLFAGPFLNLVFAVLAYWIIFVLGVSLLIPRLGPVPPESIAGLAGLKEAQEIVEVANKQTPTWEAVSIQLLKAMGDNKKIDLTVKERKTGALSAKVLDLSHWSGETSHQPWLSDLGLFPFDYRLPIIAKVVAGSPAAKAGLMAGDQIMKIHPLDVSSCVAVIQIIQKNPQKKLQLSVLRSGHLKHLNIEPELKVLEAVQQEQQPKSVGFIGVEFKNADEVPADLFRLERFGIVESLERAIAKTVDYSKLTLEAFKNIILGQMSTRNVSGPLTIAKYAGATAKEGFKDFLGFLAMISISLGVMNLLPIPLLDGGQLAYCFYECCIGRPLSRTAQSVGIWCGAAILFTLMSLAFYNDLLSFIN